MLKMALFDRAINESCCSVDGGRGICRLFRPHPRALALLLPWMVANSRGWRLLSCQIPRGGDAKRRQMPRPSSTLRHFSLMAQSNSAILSILRFAFLFQLTSSFVIVLGF